MPSAEMNELEAIINCIICLRTRNSEFTSVVQALLNTVLRRLGEGGQDLQELLNRYGWKNNQFTGAVNEQELRAELYTWKEGYFHAKDDKSKTNINPQIATTIQTNDNDLTTKHLGGHPISMEVIKPLFPTSDHHFLLDTLNGHSVSIIIGSSKDPKPAADSFLVFETKSDRQRNGHVEHLSTSYTWRGAPRCSASTAFGISKVEK